MRLRPIALTAVLPLTLTFFVACSSAQKKTDTKQATPAASAPSNTTAPADTKAAKNTHKKKAKAANANAALSCAQGEDQRQASITKKDAGCEVEYSKGGETKVIATSASGTQHCEEVVAKIKKNLASAGFTCQ